MQIVADGECAHEPPCALCGSGSRYVAVSECTQDAPEGICDLDFSLDVVPVSDKVAARWLELQGRDCEAPDYDLAESDLQPGWQSARPPGSSPPQWDCVSSSGASGSGASNGGAGGDAETPSQGGQPSPDAGAPVVSDVKPSGGCTCSTAASSSWSSAPFVLLALGLLRRRRAH